MQPGRELDALIAEKVMGWTKNTTLDYVSIYYPPGPPEMNMIGHIIPDYSTDIAAAWEVVEKLRSSGSCENISLERRDGPLSMEWIVVFNNEDFYGEAESNSAPHAICLAALNALGVEV